jgi:hypothetical protein
MGAPAASAVSALAAMSLYVNTQTTAGSNPATQDTHGVAIASTGINGRYNEYKFRKLSVEWIPSISPASIEAGGRIHIAYIDNPEMMVQFEAQTLNVAKIGMVRSVKNVQSFNAWERFQYRVPLTYRRKVFNVDVTLPLGSGVDVHDRSTQGVVIIGMEYITPAAAPNGTFRTGYSLELKNLAINFTT